MTLLLTLIMVLGPYLVMFAMLGVAALAVWLWSGLIAQSLASLSKDDK
ncbi:hypothetical protein CcrC1_gp478 [Caulobacter phage C1]|nr:hypothetical protein CcrC1_gp478 [Caulobacter phage C1]UTU08687.1 hypothetical protein CcrC2_gp460 [Caulobacter phage C2]WGN97353.1 hypothetical protein [Bertelyvirus sp.]WGN97891.1 hypothetical protein [Bertelyvirus sp.]